MRQQIWEEDRPKIMFKFLVVVSSLHNGPQFSLLPGIHTLRELPSTVELGWSVSSIERGSRDGT